MTETAVTETAMTAAPSPAAALHAACAALGTRLFTLTTLDDAAGLYRRSYTSHPAEYPLDGTKPLARDAWYDLCIAARQTWVANTPEEFRAHLFDHALIESMGLGSACNIPLGPAGGPVTLTVNLLAGPGHFTPERLTAYSALVSAHAPALLSAPP